MYRYSKEQSPQQRGWQHHSNDNVIIVITSIDMIYSAKVTLIMVCLFLFAEGTVLFYAISCNRNNTLLNFVENCTVIIASLTYVHYRSL